MLRNHPIRFFLCLVLLSMLTSGCAVAPAPAAESASGAASQVEVHLENNFGEYEGAFVLYDVGGQRYMRHNPQRCAQRFVPASTFKILNSLIALETGVIADENEIIEWDGTQYPLPDWNQHHNLDSAIKKSVVWYYQELARRVGKEKMQQYVGAAAYGNQDISGEIDTFWLEGGLRISADEQVEFLKRLYQGELPFSDRTMQIVKDILVLEKTEAHQLRGKTGSSQRVTPHTGWFVGWLESADGDYIFALNIESMNPDGMANGETARKMCMDILHTLELLP